MDNNEPNWTLVAKAIYEAYRETLNPTVNVVPWEYQTGTERKAYIAAAKAADEMFGNTPKLRELNDFLLKQRDEYAEKFKAEQLDRLQSTQQLYTEQLRLSVEIDKLTTQHKELNGKYLELVAMINYIRG